jgi:hypothetical protein
MDKPGEDWIATSLRPDPSVRSGRERALGQAHVEYQAACFSHFILFRSLDIHNLGGTTLLSHLSYPAMIRLSVICLCLIARTAHAAILASNGSRADVQAKINAAVAGDTVTIPAGIFTWTTSVSTGSKAITIQGAGIANTTIINQQGPGDVVPNDSEHVAIFAQAPETGRLRITGIRFNLNRTSNGIHCSGGVYDEVQIDNCEFLEPRGRGIGWHANLSGLVFNCRFIDCYKTNDIYAGIGTGEQDSWNMPLTLGTTQCVVVEDCTFLYTAGGWHPRNNAVGATASHGHGGRGTWRHNHWESNNALLGFGPIIDAHGNQQPVNGQNINVDPPGERRPTCIAAPGRWNFTAMSSSRIQRRART